MREFEKDLRGALPGVGRDLMDAIIQSKEARRHENEPRPGERNGGMHEKTIVTSFGPVKARRLFLSGGGGGRYPLDEMLALQGRYTPSVVEEVARLVADQTYRGAAGAFLRQQAFGISADSMRRMIAGLKEDALAFSEGFSRKTQEDAGERAPCVCVEADGTGAPMGEGELTDVKGKNGKATTREIKVGGIFAASRSAKNEPHRDEGSTTCLATSDRAEAFAVRLRGEFDRRYDRRPPATLFLTDGAPWLRKIQEAHFPFAVPILDLYHAIEHLKPVLTAMKLKEGTDEWKGGHAYYARRIKSGKVASVIGTLRRRHPRREMDRALGYYEDNQDRMRYDEYRRQGWFVGSGVIESACKMIVRQRFKQVGMHWTVNGLDPLLQVRTFAKSNRLEEFFDYRLRAVKMMRRVA